MPYTKTGWREHVMSQAEKLTALNNIETQCDSINSYLDSYYHDGSYYLKSESDAKYFTSDTDGSGSGLIAEKLDGQTAAQIIALGTPIGGVVIWYGGVATIPAGWVLYEPLLNRFPVGAGGSLARGLTGGYTARTPSAASVTIAGHAITGDEIPSHTHQYIDFYRANGSASCVSGNGPNTSVSKNTTLVESEDHGHMGSTFTGDAVSIMPPYKALCYIIKVI